MRGAAALPDQSDPPAGAAEPFERADRGIGQRRRGRAADPPAGRRRRRRGERIGAGLAPAAEQKRRGAALLGGELEPAGGGHLDPAHLADHSGEAAVPHPLLHHRKRLLVIAAFGVDHPLRRQPRLGQTGREQIAADERPKHLATFAGRAGEAGGGGG